VTNSMPIRVAYRHWAVRPRYLLSALLIGAIAGLAPIATASAQQAAVVEVDAVLTEPLAQTVPIIGRLVARQAGDVAARTSGPVAKVDIEVGDRVKKGDVIAQIDASRLRRDRQRNKALIDEAEQQIKQATAEATLRQQELRRIEGLRDSVAFSHGRFEDAQQALIVAQSSVNVAEARLEIVQATLALTELDIAWATIRAPYPGVITNVEAEAGAWLATGQSVVSLINDQALEIEADVPTERIAGVIAGMVVPVQLDDGSKHSATVRVVIAEENPLSRTRRARFTPVFETPEKPLAPGQSAMVELPLGPQRDVVTVHKDAIITMGGRTFVYVAANGTANIRPVTTGEAVGARFEVVQGLRPEELVVVRGNERLQPGQSITFDGAN
jgi:RND family efflux transporter MFP subunit